MIKINLIRDRTVLIKKPAIQPEMSRFGAILVIIFFLNFVLFGWYAWDLNRDKAKKQKERDNLQREHARLQKVADEVREAEKQKKKLDERIEVIERLQENQTGPVELLNKVIAGIPDQVWLSSIAQNGPAINVEGYFLRDEALPQFIASLESSRYFSAVDLIYYEKTDTEASRFSLKCQVGKKR